MIRYLVVLGGLTVSGSLYGQAYLRVTGASTVSVTAYGAKCNWNGSTGTDDSAAFQAASNAASASYASNGVPVTITVPNGCTLGTSSGHTTISVGSGVHWQGPGSIFVPMQSTNELFLTLSTNDVSFEGLTITMVSNTSGCGPSQNNDSCSAIRWNGSSSGTGTAYKKFYARNNTIINSGWGITVLAQAGLDTLSDIHIDGNTIIESGIPVTAYQYADAIHVGGGVSAITISHNMATGRGDAGIALSTELSGSTVRQCQFATVTGNTLYEDRVGIDNSGCSNVQVTGNLVMADISTSTSNPAFRSISTFSPRHRWLLRSGHNRSRLDRSLSISTISLPGRILLLTSLGRPPTSPARSTRPMPISTIRDNSCSPPALAAVALASPAARNRRLRTFSHPTAPRLGGRGRRRCMCLYCRAPRRGLFRPGLAAALTRTLGPRGSSSISARLTRLLMIGTAAIARPARILRWPPWPAPGPG